LDGHSERVAELARGEEDLAIRAEGSVQAPVLVVTGDSEIGRRAVAARHGLGGGSSGDDFAVGLDCDRAGLTPLAGKIGGDRTPCAERCVEAAIGVVPGQGKVRAGVPCGDDLAVGLYRHRRGGLEVRVEVSADLAAGAEGRVEVAGVECRRRCGARGDRGRAYRHQHDAEK